MVNPVAAKMSDRAIDNVIEAIQDFYFSTDSPPPKFVLVERKTVRGDKNDPSWFYAKVTIEVEYIPRKPKSHKVYLRFKLNDRGRVVPSSVMFLL